MSAVKKLVGILVSLLFALFFAAVLFANAEKETLSGVFTDGSGGFFTIGTDHRTVSHISAKGSHVTEAYFDVEGIVSDGTQSFAFGRPENVTFLLSCGKNADGKVVMIGNIKLKADCLAIADGGYLYAVDEGDDRVITKFSPGGDRYEFPDYGESIELLFYHKGSGRVFALTSGGVIDPDYDRLIPCQIPALPVRINNDLFCDRKGNIYSFNESTGFELTASFGECDSLCCTENEVYMLSDSTITKTDLNGNLLGIFEAEDKLIDDILSSGDSVAMIYDGKPELLRDDDFIPPNDDQPFTAQSSVYMPSLTEKSDPEPSREEKSNPDSSVPEPSESRTSSVESSGSESSDSNSKASTQPSSEVSEKQSRTPQVSYRTQDHTSRKESSFKGHENEVTFTGSGAVLQSSTYIIHDDIIENIPYDTTIATIKKNLVCSGSIRFYNRNGRELTSGKLGTGSRLEVISDDGQTLSFYLIVSGDLTGEGNFNSNDLRLIVKAATGESELDKYALLAADVNHDKVFDTLDISLVCNEYYKNGCSSGNSAFIL